MTGTHKETPVWEEKMTAVIPSLSQFLICCSRQLFHYAVKLFCFVFFLNMWFAETAHSICGSSFYRRADLVPRLQGGKETEGKTCLCEFVSVGHQNGSKLCSLHRWCSFLTLNDFWLVVMLRKETCAEGMQKKNICYLSSCCTERASLALLRAWGTITVGQP